MKVALLADAVWLEHEAAMLRHLVVGLTDESVGVVLVLPVGDGGGTMAGELTGGIPGAGEVVTYRASRLGVLRDWRLWSLRKRLSELAVDVLHVMDESLVGVGLRMGQAMGLPVVVGCWSMGGVKLVVDQIQRRRAKAGQERKGGPGGEEGGGKDAGAAGVRLLGVTEGITEQLRVGLAGMSGGLTGGMEDVRVELVRPGVMRSGEEVGEPLSAAGAALCVLVMSNGKMDGAMSAFFEGAAKARTKLTQMQLFVYSTVDQSHKWWGKAKELGLLGQVCMVGPDSGSQRMLVRSDVVILPQAGGILRTLLLATMGAGRPVIAVADAGMDDLIEGTTARVMEEPTAEQWTQTLLELPTQVESLRALGVKAREYVKQEHGIASYANRMIGVYREAVAEPWKFGGE